MVKISVIMGIYNCEETLVEAINSILTQTFNDWELIMCDDGSTDGTYDLAKQFAKQYDNIRVYRNKKNMGLNYTLNHCLKHAKGTYIARMDGDDISLPERFQVETDFLDKHPEYAIVSTPIQYFDESGIFMVGQANGEPERNRIVLSVPFCHAACMVRREAFEKVNGYTVEDKYLRVEDWQLWIKMYAAGFKGYNINKPLYMMRDDRDAKARRKFKYRLNQVQVACLAVKELNLAKWRYIFAIRPILVGLLPGGIYTFLHKRKLKMRL
ncbi:MAG: glycosyltransferase [Lachnospiraceae bacterium]|nr:glycosyltransferase [Lachnospiraceae bacterium]